MSVEGYNMSWTIFFLSTRSTFWNGLWVKDRVISPTAMEGLYPGWVEYGSLEWLEKEIITYIVSLCGEMSGLPGIKVKDKSQGQTIPLLLGYIIWMYQLRNKFHFSFVHRKQWVSCKVSDINLTSPRTHWVHTSMNNRKMQFNSYIYTFVFTSFLFNSCEVLV